MKTLYQAYKRQSFKWIIGAIFIMIYPFLFSLLTFGKINVSLLLAGIALFNSMLWMAEKRYL